MNISFIQAKNGRRIQEGTRPCESIKARIRNYLAQKGDCQPTQTPSGYPRSRRSRHLFTPQRRNDRPMPVTTHRSWPGSGGKVEDGRPSGMGPRVCQRGSRDRGRTRSPIADRPTSHCDGDDGAIFALQGAFCGNSGAFGFAPVPNYLHSDRFYPRRGTTFGRRAPYPQSVCRGLSRAARATRKPPARRSPPAQGPDGRADPCRR